MEKGVRTGYAALALVSFTWGAAFTISKFGNAYMPPLFLAGVRQFSAGLCIAFFFLFKKHGFPTGRELKIIFFQSILLLLFGNGLLTYSMAYISSGLAAIISALTPLFITLFNILFSRSAKISVWMFWGFIIGFVGVCIIFYDYLDRPGSPMFVAGVLMALISVLSWSLGSVYSSLQKVSVSVLFGVGLQMLFSGAMLLAICFITGVNTDLLELPAAGWYSLFYLVVFGSLLSYTAYQFALTKLPVTLVSLYAYINPVVAVWLGWVLLNESTGLRLFLGAAVVLYGVYLVSRESNRGLNQGDKKERELVENDQGS